MSDRVIADTFVAAPATGVCTRTRLRLSDKDLEVLLAVGTYFGSVANKDLADRNKLGAGSKHKGRKERKRGLTPACHSRAASSITGRTADLYHRQKLNTAAEIKNLVKKISRIEKALTLPLKADVQTGAVYGYRTAKERWEQSQELIRAKDRLARCRQQEQSGNYAIVVGGKGLLRERNRLESAAEIEEWKTRWDDARRFLQFAGDHQAPGGNYSLRVQDKALELRLPNTLLQYANHKKVFYRFSCDVSFKHLGEEWLEQTQTAAVGYSVNRRAGKWLLTAAWTRPVETPLELAALQQQRTLAVDFNADHLTAWAVDQTGNPVSGPTSYYIDFKNLSSTTKDAYIRHLVTNLLDQAADLSCHSVSIEDLCFDNSDTGQGRNLRRHVGSMPTAVFRDRLVAMAARRKIAVAVVDPAYTSKQAGRWLKTERFKSATVAVKTIGRHKRPVAPGSAVTIHHGAAYNIGRRMQGLVLAPKSSGTGRQQCMPCVRSSDLSTPETAFVRTLPVAPQASSGATESVPGHGQPFSVPESKPPDIMVPGPSVACSCTN